MANDSSYFVGLDIGGTTVKAVLVNHLAEQAGPLAEVRSLVKDGYEATRELRASGVGGAGRTAH